MFSAFETFRNLRMKADALGLGFEYCTDHTSSTICIAKNCCVLDHPRIMKLSILYGECSEHICSLHCANSEIPCLGKKVTLLNYKKLRAVLRCCSRPMSLLTLWYEWSRMELKGDERNEPNDKVLHVTTLQQSPNDSVICIFYYLPT
jgi:hypothetical protein